MKIAIYAICKNEESNIREFLTSVHEADAICILDTGSTDNTLNVLSKTIEDLELTNVWTEQALFEPFSFAVARNVALSMAEKTDCDFALFVDLDERPSSGWYHHINALLELHSDKEFNTIGTYMNLMQDGVSTTRYVQHKGHALGKNAVWKYNAHEIFILPDEEINLIQTDVEFYHTKDETKVRNYLEALEADYLENKNDHRCIYYYGRELYYARKYTEACDVLHTANESNHGYFISQHLEVLRTLSNSTGNASYLYTAISMSQLSPDLYYDLALNHFRNRNYNACIGFCELLFNSQNKDNFNSNDVMFKDPAVLTWKPYDIMSVSYWELNEPAKAVYCIAKALEYNPTDTRLRSNLNHFKTTIEKEQKSEDSSN